MLQPVTPTWALLLLLAVTAAEAQPARGRSVTVAARPGEPLPEVRVASGYTTAIVLDASVDKDSVQLVDTPQGTPRIRVLAVGERSAVKEKGRGDHGCRPGARHLPELALSDARATGQSWRCRTRTLLHPSVGSRCWGMLIRSSGEPA